MNGSRCDFGLFLIIKFLPLRPESWVVRDCLALKWLKPGLRERILPFLVIFNLLAYDLFVFIPFPIFLYLLYNLFGSLYSRGQALRTFFIRVGYFVFFSNEV